MSLYRHVRSGLLWTATQQWGVQAVRMAVLLVLARLVRPEAFGTFALASTLVGLLQLLCGQGMTAAITQRHQLGEQRLGAAFLALFACSGLAAAGLISAVPHLGGHLASLLRALAWGLPLNALSGVPVAVWRRELRFRRIALVTTGSQMLASLLAVVLALRGFGIWSLAARTLAEAVLMVLFTLHAAPWASLWRASWRAYREMLRFGLPIAGSNLLALGRNRLDELLIGGALGMEALGFYALARREMDGIASLLPAVIGNALVPVLSRVQSDRAQVRAVLLRGMGLIGALTLPALAAMGLAASTWVPLLLGERWRPAVPLLQGFAVIAATRALVGFNLITLPATGHPGKRLVLELVTSAISLVAVVAALPYGIRAVVFASAVCLLLLAPVELHWMARWLPVSLRDQVIPLRPPLLFAALVLAGITVLQHITAFNSYPIWRLVIAAVLAGLAILLSYRALPPLAGPLAETSPV